MERGKESGRMVRDIFQEVEKILDNYSYTSYHIFCSIGEEVWSPDYSSISFTVNFWNDQGEGSEWKEYWNIDQDGRIHTEEKIFESLEEFKSEW